MKFVDLTNKIFGRLRVHSRAPNIGKFTAWHCNCTCGTSIIVQGSNLKSGHTQSCGCFSREIHTKHGLYHDKLYKIWASIVQRTSNPRSPEFINYGARGIQICDEWKNNPERFIKYCRSLKGCYQPGLSLDRKNNDGNYEPGNLRFVNNSTQQINRRPFSNTGEKYISHSKRDNNYEVKKTISGKTIHYGQFKTLQEAINCKIKNNL